jgi:hypothetical protein
VPAHRRGWVSLYAPLAKGQIDEGDTRELLARYPSAEDRPAMYAVDVSPWPPFSPLRGPTHRAVVSGGLVLSNARCEKGPTLYDVKMRRVMKDNFLDRRIM